MSSKVFSALLIIACGAVFLPDAISAVPAYAAAPKKKKAAVKTEDSQAVKELDQKVAQKAAAESLAAMTKMYVEGIVLDADAKTSKGIVNVGSKNGVKAGDRFIVARRGEDIVDPATKKVIRIKQILVGEVEIAAASDTYSDVKITKGAAEMAKNDAIRSRTSVATGLKAVNKGFRKIEVTWSVQPEPETKGYVVYRSDSPTTDYKPIGKTSKQEDVRFVDEHSSGRPMADSKTYYYRVSALNTLDKESEPSTAISIASMGPPAPAKNLAGDSKKIRAVPLKWEAHENQEVAGYRIYRSDSQSGKMELIKDIKGRGEKSFTDYGGGSSTEPKLEDSRTYYYSISAYSPYNDEGLKSGAVSVKTADPPAIPKKFDAKGWQPRKVPLGWKAHEDDNVKGYYIYRSGEDKGPYAQIAEIRGRDKTSYVDGGDTGGFGSAEKLKDFTLYFYKIEAYNWAGSRSGMSEAVSATTKPAPMAPESFKAASNRPKQVPLDWRKNPETDIKEYHVFRADSENGAFRKIFDIPAAKNYHLDDKLENSKTYYYKIQAVDTFGLEGEFSPVVAGTTKSPPAPVAGFKWAREGSKVVLKWDRNKEVGATDYIVYRRSFFGWQKAGSTRELFYIVPDMKAGVKEDFAVSCVDVDKLEGEKSGAMTVDLR
ncbi:MAG: hypothetical protein HZB29_06245 [Nitrospinae bacterium]|nr:hypothetical protein [Nitrospinota bacterium]